MKSGSSLAAAFSLFLVFSSAHGAEEEARDVLPEVVIEANRASILPAHIPAAATVISEKEIAEYGARSVAELLAARGGVRISSTSGNISGGAVHLRGFGENSSSRVLIMVDGKPVNRADMGAVSLLEVPVSRLETVEILRGSQSARFGDNAVGGVINLVTKKAKKEGEGYLETAGGSDGYAMFRAGYGAGHGDHSLRLDLERNFTSGWRENSASEVESAAVRYDLDLTGGVELDAGFAWTDEYTEYPGPLPESRYREDPRQSVYFRSGQGDQYFSGQTIWRSDATLSWNEGREWEFSMPLIWTRRDQSWNMGPGFHTDNLADTAAFSPVWSRKGADWRLDLGASAKYDRLDLTQFAEIRRQHKTAEADLTRWVYGGFAAAEWEPWDSWHLTASARIERSTVDARAASMRFPTDPDLNFKRGSDDLDWAFQLGLKWEGDSGMGAWLRYDRLYRLPSTDEIASYQGFPLSVPFNDQLRAETGHQVEMGMEYISGGWTARVNAFAQWLEGEIAYDYMRNLNLNFANTRRTGIETELSRRTGAWEMALRHTWLRAEFRDGDYKGKEVYLVPNQEFSALLGWRPIAPVLLQGEFQYTGSAFEGNDFRNNQPKLPEHGVVNVLARWEPSPGFSLYARVNNLFDERYATVKYSGVWYPAAGRQFLLGMKKDF